MARWALVLALCASCAHRTGAQEVARPRLRDVDAAPESVAERRSWISPRAYQHYLAALLARERDDHATAADELREAVLFDPDSAHLRTLLAEELARAGHLDDAEESLRSALLRDPAHAPAHLLAARIALVRDRPSQARAELHAALDSAPGDVEATRELVRLEIQLGDLAAAGLAAEGLDRAAQERHDDDGGAVSWRLRAQAAAAWVEVGRAFAQRREDAAADEAFSRARAIDPGAGETFAAQAGFLESRRRFGDARDATLRLLARNPDAPDVLAALVRLSLQVGEFDVASAHLRKLIALAAELGPVASAGDDGRRDLASALFRAGLPLLAARRSEDAESAFRAALRLYPHHAQIALYRGLAIDQRGRHREAAHLFEQLERSAASAESQDAAARGPTFLASDPSALVVEAQVQAALARGRAGESQESIRRIRSLFAQKPADEAVALGLLEALDRAGRASEAAQLLAAAVRAHPDEDALLFALGSAHDRAGRRDEAAATMRELLRRSPHHAGALNYVGYSMVEQGERLDEAEKLLLEAVELRPDDGAVADSYGYCLLRLGRVQSALAELRRADHLSPGDPVILGHLGDALLAAGLRGEAQSAFRRALGRLAPAHQQRGARAAQLAAGDLPARSPEPGDDQVRADLLRKIRSLTPR